MRFVLSTMGLGVVYLPVEMIRMGTAYSNLSKRQVGQKRLTDKYQLNLTYIITSEGNWFFCVAVQFLLAMQI
jgi:hypothetical protein